MKVADLSHMTNTLGSMPKTRTLADIVDDIASKKNALNPYTLTAQKVIKNLKQYFEFPFLEPNVINPHGVDKRDAHYMEHDDGNGKFREIEFRNTGGMDPPPGANFCVDDDNMPFFVDDKELFTQIGKRDYRVFNHDSFSKFITELMKDMSFYKPMFKGVIEKNAQHSQEYIPKKGDLVFIPGQQYGKLGVVNAIEQKDYLVKLSSPEYFHQSIIGVNKEELALRSKARLKVKNRAFEEEIERKELAWSKPDNKKDISRLSIGSANVFVESDVENDRLIGLGYATTIGYDPKCLTVMPFSFKDDERYPWGNIKKLSIPVGQVIPIATLEDMKEGYVHDKYFADDREIMSVVEEVTRKEIDNPHIRGLMLFSDLSRYNDLYKELINCPDVKKDVASAKFIKLLTSNGLDGIQRLADIGKRDVVDVAKDLLGYDLKKAEEEFFNVGEEVYRGYVEALQAIIKDTTGFDSFEKLLQYASPKINLYQMPRNGRATIAFISKSDYVQRGKISINDVIGNNQKKPFFKKDELQDKLKGSGYDLLEAEKVIRSYLYGDMKRSIVSRLSEKSLKKLKETGSFGKINKEIKDAPFRSIEDQDKEEGVIMRVEYIQNRYLHRDEIIETPFLCFYRLRGTKYRIMEKKESVKFGLDIDGRMTYPGLELVNSTYKMSSINDKDQYNFLQKVLGRIEKNVDFDGKDVFIKAVKDLSECVEDSLKKKEEERSRWRIGTDIPLCVRYMEAIAPLYKTILSLTDNPETHKEIVTGLIGNNSLMLEAFYDYADLQKMMAIRDHWFRGHIHEKLEYLRPFGIDDLGDNGFADEFYDALVKADMYHRGFPRDESGSGMFSLTRKNINGREDYERPSFGNVPSIEADRIIQEIKDRTTMLAYANNGNMDSKMIEFIRGIKD